MRLKGKYMFNYKIQKGDLIAVDSTRSVTHGAKRFMRNVLNGLVAHTDLRIILFSDSKDFDSYASERIQIVRIKINYGYVIRTLNAIFFIPIRARWHRASLLYSPWDIGPIINILPFVLGIHNPNSVTPRKNRGIKANLIHEFLSKISANRAIAIEFPSNSAAKEIGDHMNIKQEKRNVIYHGAEVSRWKNRIDKLKLSGGDNNFGEYFIFWSWFFPTKNITVLMKAFSQFIAMHQSSKKIKLVCVGNFAYRGYKRKVLSLIKTLKLSDNIVFIENADDDELVRLIYHAKVMVIPALYETFGFMYVEGRIFSKPFIVADTEVAREITEGQCIYFKGQSPKDLAVKMTAAIARKDSTHNYRIADVFYEEYAARDLASFLKRCFDNATLL